MTEKDKKNRARRIKTRRIKMTAIKRLKSKSLQRLIDDIGSPPELDIGSPPESDVDISIKPKYQIKKRLACSKWDDFEPIIEKPRRWH